MCHLGWAVLTPYALLRVSPPPQSWAIDLFYDLIARFAGDPQYGDLPVEFYDVIRGAQQEAKHFCLLANRLEEMGSRYGALPAHDGLWETAEMTAHNLPARLAVEHCVHEARGVDVLPTTAAKFQASGDSDTYRLLMEVSLGMRGAMHGS